MTLELRAHLQETLGSTYTLSRELGGGGMSRVFVARDETLGRDVAIKVLSPELAATLSAERFTREIRLAATLQEPHIVPVLAAGHSGGLPWYSMPFLSGESVRARIARGPLGPVEATSILRNVAQALAYAHERGVVHRDIKPENVLLSSGTAVVADFGIAKALSASTTAAPGGTLTSAGTSIGTPAYMAPEQAVGDVNTDHRADLYAWGVMAYELYSGAHPFAKHSSPAALVTAHLTERPAPLTTSEAIPAGVAAMVMQCLEKDPAQRPSSASELIAALDQVQVSGAARRNAPAGARSSRLRWSAAAVAILVVVAVLARGRMPAGTATPRIASATTSIAILPFESVGGDTANAYFAEGIADALTTALTQLPGIRVAGRSSAARFRGRGASAREVGVALDVGSVLEGTVRRAGDRVRVTAQLTGASDGLVVWTDSYDREAKDVFALQDDITRAIVVALRGKLASNSASSAPVVGTTNPEAYDLYLRGLYLYRQRGASLKRGADLLEQAIAKDSTFARAHAALASALLLEPYYSPTRVRDVLPRARAAADRAVALDSTLSDAHLAKATALLHAFEWDAAVVEARRGVELDQASSEAHYRLGFILLTSGRAEDAIPEFAKAKALDPLYAVAGAYLSYANGLAGHIDVAIAEGTRALDVDPTLMSSMTLLARTYGQAGRSADAVAIARRALASAKDPRVLGLVANTLARHGQLDESRGIMRKLEALPKDYPQVNTGLTYAYLGLGDTTRALAAMERAVASDGVLLLSAVPQDNTFDSVRSSARFAAVLRSVRLDPVRFTGRSR